MRITGEKEIFPFFGAESLSTFDLVGESLKNAPFPFESCCFSSFFHVLVDWG